VFAPEELVPVFPVTLVLGGERSGVSPEAVEAADGIVAIPMLGMATSRPPLLFCFIGSLYAWNAWLRFEAVFQPTRKACRSIRD
jgi:hypothetical protein